MEGNNILQIPEIKSGVSFDVAGSHYAHQAKYFIDLLANKKIDLDNLNTSIETQKIIENIYKMQLNKFILGHNSFFGINHANYEKGKLVSEKFKNNYHKMIDVLQHANKNNINNFMISTLDESENFIKELNKTNLKNDMNFLFCFHT